MTKALALVTAVALASTACKMEHYVIGGTVVGGTSGAMIGNQISDEPAGAVLGALTGAFVGAFLGLCVGWSKEEPDSGDDD